MTLLTFALMIDKLKNQIFIKLVGVTSWRFFTFLTLFTCTYVMPAAEVNEPSAIRSELNALPLRCDELAVLIAATCASCASRRCDELAVLIAATCVKVDCARLYR